MIDMNIVTWLIGGAAWLSVCIMFYFSGKSHGAAKKYNENGDRFYKEAEKYYKEASKFHEDLFRQYTGSNPKTEKYKGPPNPFPNIPINPEPLEKDPSQDRPIIPKTHGKPRPMTRG